jgi:hypothetical protein
VRLKLGESTARVDFIGLEQQHLATRYKGDHPAVSIGGASGDRGVSMHFEL